MWPNLYFTDLSENSNLFMSIIWSYLIWNYSKQRFPQHQIWKMLTNCKNIFSKQCEGLEFRSFAMSSSSLINLLSFTNVIFSFDLIWEQWRVKGSFSLTLCHLKGYVYTHSDRLWYTPEISWCFQGVSKVQWHEMS